MEQRTLQYIAQACAGEQLTGQGSALAKRVCTDSRQAHAGDLFIALRGERFDGHHFLEEVARRKVAAVVVERSTLPVPSLNVAVIAVENTREALGRLAAQYRRDFNLPAIAVGGSNGKSTTKELIAAVLRQKFSTLWSEASFNNDIGVPLTLLKLERHHQAAVFEAGTNHPGELAPLVAMIQPQLGVITSIGREHLEFFGDLNGVAEEEGVLAELLPANGKLFLNASPDFGVATSSSPQTIVSSAEDFAALASRIAQRSRAPIVRVGLAAGHDWSAGNIRADDRDVTFDVRAPRPDYSSEFRIRLLGRHQVLNALFAIAVGAELGLSAEEVRRGLLECRPLKMRLQLSESNGVRILDDSYNANADSMLAALQTLHDLPCPGRRIAVLGDMAELGAQSAAAHTEVGHRVAEFGIDQLFTVGQMSHLTAEAARAAGVRDVREFSSVAETAQAVKSAAQPGDLVLLKASRVAGLERVSELLRQVRVPPTGGTLAANLLAETIC